MGNRIASKFVCHNLSELCAMTTDQSREESFGRSAIPSGLKIKINHFAILIRGAIAADFRKGEKSREEIADLMAGGESMADLEASIDADMAPAE